MNKKYSIAASVLMLIASFGLNSCSKVASILSQFLTFNTPAQNFTIPPVPNAVAAGTQIIMPTISGAFTYNLDSFIKAGTGGQMGINNIANVHINSCVLTVTNPTDSANWQQFQTVTISLTSATNSTPYVLTVNQADIYSSTMTLTPTDTTSELKSYLQGSAFNYSIGAQMRRGTTDSMKCNAVFSFTIKLTN